MQVVGCHDVSWEYAGVGSPFFGRGVVLSQAEKLAVGSEDGEGVGGFPLEEEEHGGGAVEEEAAHEEVAEGAWGEVFVEHEEVVPVVEEEFAGVVHGEGTAAEVVNHGGGAVAEMPARVA